MTVLSEINKITYIGSLAQTLYPIPFEYVNTDNIKVSVYTSNDEFVEDWTFSTQYVIEGGNVKVLPGYEIDDTKKLLVLRSLDIVQDNKYREGGDFPAKSTELSFDKLTMIAQQHQEVLDRCVKVEVVGKQKPKELLDEVYSKLDSATAVAEEAIAAANQAQTAADNATSSVVSAERTLIETQTYVDNAKVDINNTVAKGKEDINTSIDEATMNISDTVDAGISSINSVKDSAINTINTAVSTAESNISTIVSDAEGSITNIAIAEANKAIASAAQEATNTATANLNSYVDGTVKPSLQTYVDQAQADANSAATSMEQAALSATAASNYASNASADADNAAESATHAATSATDSEHYSDDSRIWAEGTDSEVQGLGGVHSSKVWSETAQAVVDGKADDANVVHKTGDETISGTKTFTANINSNYGVAYGSNRQTLGVQGFTSDSKLAVLFQGWAQPDANVIGMYCFNPSGKHGEIFIKINENGNVSTSAPTPPTTDNSNKIATTAFFRNNMKVVSALPSSPIEGVFYFVKE